MKCLILKNLIVRKNRRKAPNKPPFSVDGTQTKQKPNKTKTKQNKNHCEAMTIAKQ